MKKTGAWLAVYALEQIGVRYTFGIPGVHNTELYDELGKSEKITPILITHEQCGAFMAEAISRTTDHIGCLAIVPAAGMTHAMSGIGEAYLDGIPLLVISGGIRRDTGRHYQLHDINQQRVLDGITKAAFLVDRHEDVIPTIYQAYEIATSDEPGPVFVELSGNVQLFTGEVGSELPVYQRRYQPPAVDTEAIKQAASVIASAQRPGLYLGWGAREATAQAVALADILSAPVATTLQGLSVFPANHPLHAGMGFGPSAVPSARKAFEGCDGLIAVGVRFAELATGSYGMTIPERLIHIDINPQVFNKNYPASVTIQADAGEALSQLVAALKETSATRDGALMKETIKREKESFTRGWTAKINKQRVTPALFFRELRARLEDDAYMVVDDGNHTFLAAELFPVHRSKHFISPTDFNCMGYCVPAAIGVKLTHPDHQVVAIVGDGAFLMTSLEIVTATRMKLGAIFFVFHDGELAQISQFQQIPLNRKTCTVLADVKIEGIATATGAAFLSMNHDEQAGAVIDKALKTAATGRPVIVDVKIDYSRKSEFTQGVVKVNLSRFALNQKLRFIGRALKRHILG